MPETFDDNFPQSPITPVRLGLDDTFRFDCRSDIACFNQCCRNIDITLTPCDILRLKKRLGLTSQEFLHLHTVPFEMDAHGLPGIKMKTRGDTTVCQFLTDSGCKVYSDRPTACRYYALGVGAMRKAGSPLDEDFYFVVKEEHCLGHRESRLQTIGDYRKEQGIEEYDALNREWRRIVLKKRSCGPTVGKPSLRSMQLFFMASYDLDGFRDFVASASFGEVYDLGEELKNTLLHDEIQLMQFAFRFLKQVLFGENTLPLRPDTMEKRLARRGMLFRQAADAESPSGET